MKVRRFIKKFVPILVTCALIGALLCLPVSAEDSYVALPITVTKVWTNHVEDNTYTQWDTNYYNIKIPYNSGKNAFASLWTVNNDDTTNYYNYKFKFKFNNMEPTDFTLTFNGVTYEVQKMVVDEWETYYYVDIHDIKLKNPNSRLDCSFSFTSATSASIYFQAFYQYSDLNVIVDNQNENTDKIIDNQDKNTSEITNGWDTDADTTVPGADDYSSAESALMDDTQSAASSKTSEVTDSALASFQKHVSAFSAISTMFKDLLQSSVPELGSLVYISLALGIVPLLVGLTINEFKSHDKFNAEQKRAAACIQRGRRR